MIQIYTDGSFNRSNTTGGWAALIIDGANRKVTSGNILANNNPTNNRMEMTAAINGLNEIPLGVEAEIVSDSEYLVKTMNMRYRRKANLDLWNQLDILCKERIIRWKWTRAHAGTVENEFVDALAGWESGLTREKPNLEFYLNTGLPADNNLTNELPHTNPETGFDSNQLTHIDGSGRSHMVDIGDKPYTLREAVAKGSVIMQTTTLQALVTHGLEKGDVLSTARLAGINGAKYTPYLIPLCHPIPLSQVTVEFLIDTGIGAVHITAFAKATYKTGVEMEALTAVATAALTIYDMCKAIDRTIAIEHIRLAEKRGGRSGDLYLEK